MLDSYPWLGKELEHTAKDLDLQPPASCTGINKPLAALDSQQERCRGLYICLMWSGIVYPFHWRPNLPETGLWLLENTDKNTKKKKNLFPAEILRDAYSDSQTTWILAPLWSHHHLPLLPAFLQQQAGGTI